MKSGRENVNEILIVKLGWLHLKLCIAIGNIGVVTQMTLTQVELGKKMAGQLKE